MKTTLIDRKERRWRASLADVSQLARAVELAIHRRAEIDVHTSVRAFTDESEFEYDSVEEFNSGADLDEQKLRRIVLTTDNFAREKPLTAEISLSKFTGEPAVFFKTRGHDEDKTKGLADEIERLLGKYRGRGINVAWVPYAVVALYLIGQYLFFSYADLGGLPDVVFYILVLVVAVFPAVLLTVIVLALQRLYPQVEFAAEEFSRSDRNQKKAFKVITAVAGSILLPIVGTLISRAIGLGD